MNSQVNASVDKEPLLPHKYPWWVIGAAVFLGAAVLYALALSPGYFVASYDLKKGKAAYHARDYERAIDFYERCLKRVPSSEEARMSLAVACFSTKNPGYHRLAFQWLKGMPLDQYKWRRLAVVMPPSYQASFKDGKPS